MKQPEAGTYKISLGYNSSDELVPIAWKRDSSGDSYSRIFADEQKAEFNALVERSEELAARADALGYTKYIGSAGLRGLVNEAGEDEAIILSPPATNEEQGKHLVFHPLEWQAFLQGVVQGEFDYEEPQE